MVNQRTADRMTLLAGAAIGSAFFIWIAGSRVIDPTEVDWVMQGDWIVHWL